MSNSVILSQALASAQALLNKKYNLINQIKTPEIPPPFPSKLIDELCDLEPGYQYHKVQFTLFKQIYFLLSISNQTNSKQSTETQITGNKTVFEIFENVIEKLYALLLINEEIFIDMLRNEKTNALILALYVMDLMHHKSPIFRNDHYASLNTLFLSLQSTKMTMCLEALSSKLSHTDHLTEFTSSFSPIVKLQNEEQKIEFLNKRLMHFETLELDFNAPHDITTSWLQLLLSTLVMNIIEKNIIQPENKYPLAMSYMSTFCISVEERKTPLSTHLGLYFHLWQLAKKQYDTFSIYSNTSTSLYTLLTDLSKSHLTAFGKHRTPQDYDTKDMFGLTHSIETLLSSQNNLTIRDNTETPSNDDDRIFWVLSYFSFKVSSQYASPQMPLRLIKLIAPLILKLIKYNRYSEAHDLITLTFLNIQQYQTQKDNHFDILPYSRALLLLSFFKEQNYSTFLVHSNHLNRPVNDLCFSSSLINHTLNAMLHIAAIEISSNDQLTNLIHFIESILEMITKDGFENNKLYINPLKAFNILIGALSLLDKTNIYHPLTIKIKLDIKALSILFNPKLFSNQPLLKQPLMNKLLSKASIFI